MQDWTQSDYFPLQEEATGACTNVDEDALKRQFTLANDRVRRRRYKHIE